MANAWDQFAPVTDEEYSDFEQFAPEQSALPQDQYLAELQRRFDEGGTPEQLAQIVRAQGIDPSAANLEQALAARAAGRVVRFTPEKAEIAPETAGQALYRGVGDVAEGVGDLLGLVGNPLNTAINAVAGTNLSTDLGGTLRDLVGAPAPVTDREKLLSDVGGAGASAIATAGAALPARALSGMTGYVAREIAATPAADVAAGVTASLAANAGGAVGEAVGGDAGRTIGEFAGGVVGGVAGLKGAQKTAAMLDRLIGRVPASVALRPDGTLTEDGREIAVRAGASEDDVRRAYARKREGKPRPVNLAERREAARNRQAPPPAVMPGGATAEMPQRVGNVDQKTRAIEEEIGRRLEDGRAFDAPAAPPPPPRDYYTEAREEGIRLTRGQAEQDFDVQNDENSLRTSATSEGNQARQFFAQQQQDIAGAVDRLRARFGPDAGNAADRGQIVKDAVAELRDNGAEGVRQLYQAAESLGGQGLRLDTAGIKDAAMDVLIDEAVPEQVKRAVSQELARYGIIGRAEPTNEVGLTKVVLDDGSSVTIRGPIRDLNASNAESLRQAINRIYDPTRPNLSGQSIKPAIDDALSDALEQAADQGEGQIKEAYTAARNAYQMQRRTFHAKDIIDNLTAAKKGTDTPVLLPERAIAQVIGAGKEGVSNLRRVKGLLLSAGTESSRQAWAAIQHQALADIFDAAWSRNVNHGSGQIGDVISGAKLNSAIDKFGVEKLRTLLSPEDFNGLMKLRRVIGVATIPISGTTNPSGTATKIINYLRAGTLRLAAPIPGLSSAIDAGGNLFRKAKEISATRKTLEGITNYTGPDSSASIDQRARDFVREYIETGKSGRLVPTSINLSATQSASREDGR